MTVEEDVDVVGVSMHNGAHLTLAAAVVGALRAARLETPVVIGGIVHRPTSRSSCARGWPPPSAPVPRTRRSWPRCATPLRTPDVSLPAVTAGCAEVT